MGNIGSLIGKLSNKGLGEHVLFPEGVRMKVSKSTEGCDGCIFDTEEKADGCRFKVACFAHLRKDRQSVIFANPSIK